MGRRPAEPAALRELSPGDVLTGALAETRPVLSSPAARELVDGLLAGEPGGDLAGWLVAAAAGAPERRQVLGDVLGSVSRRLEPVGEAWQALALALDRLFGSGVQPLGRLPFVGEPLLEQLRTEAHRQLPAEPGAGRTEPGPAGRVLAGLAVSRQLRDAVSGAFGFAVVPTYDAVYLHDPPGSHVQTHVDTRDYELVVHLVLEHQLPQDGSPGSALLVHLPERDGPSRLPVEPGEAVALRGRGTLHSWEPLREDERRIMTAVGFASSA